MTTGRLSLNLTAGFILFPLYGISSNNAIFAAVAIIMHFTLTKIKKKARYNFVCRLFQFCLSHDFFSRICSTTIHHTAHVIQPDFAYVIEENAFLANKRERRFVSFFLDIKQYLTNFPISFLL